jgi:hypothetical protein
VAGRDGRLQAIRARGLDRARALEPREPARDQRAIPALAVLIGEEHRVAATVRARRDARRRQLHEGDEPLRLGLPGISAASVAPSRSASAQTSVRTSRSLRARYGPR